MWPLLVLLLLDLASCGSAQISFKTIESVEYNYENKTILIPCFATNVNGTSLKEVFIKWRFKGEAILVYDGPKNEFTHNSDFPSAHIILHELLVGNASLIMELRHAVPGTYNCEVTDLARHGAIDIELKLGPSLLCYSCINPVDSCKMEGCTVYFDACLYIKAKTKSYYKCWKSENCNYNYLSNDLGEKTLQYKCCKTNLCNKVKRSRSGKSITGTIALLVTPLLIAFWRLLI